MTINGILKAPPDIPTAPAKEPTAAVIGNVTHRLTV
jgi:hypothetical protein